MCVCGDLLQSCFVCVNVFVVGKKGKDGGLRRSLVFLFAARREAVELEPHQQGIN